MPPKQKDSNSEKKTDIKESDTVPEKEPERVEIKIEPNTVREFQVSCELYASFGPLPPQIPITKHIKVEPADICVPKTTDTTNCDVEITRHIKVEPADICVPETTDETDDSDVEILGSFQPFNKQIVIKQERDFTDVGQSSIGENSNSTDTTRLVKLDDNLLKSANVVKQDAESDDEIMIISEFSVEKMDAEQSNDVICPVNVIKKENLDPNDTSIQKEKDNFVKEELPDTDEEEVGQNISQNKMVDQNISENEIVDQNISENKIVVQNINENIMVGHNINENIIVVQDINENIIEGQNINENIMVGQNIVTDNIMVGQNIGDYIIVNQNKRELMEDIIDNVSLYENVQKLIGNDRKNATIPGQMNIERGNEKEELNSILNEEEDVSSKSATAEDESQSYECVEDYLTAEEKLFLELEQSDILEKNYTTESSKTVTSKKIVHDAVYTSDLFQKDVEKNRVEEELSCLKQLCFTPRKYRSDFLYFSKVLSRMRKMVEIKDQETLQEHTATTFLTTLDKPDGKNLPGLKVPGPNVVNTNISNSVTEFTVHKLSNINKPGMSLDKNIKPNNNLKRKIISFPETDPIHPTHSREVRIPALSIYDECPEVVPQKIPKYHSGPITSNSLQEDSSSGISEQVGLDAIQIHGLCSSGRNGRNQRLIQYHSGQANSTNNFSLQDAAHFINTAVSIESRPEPSRLPPTRVNGVVDLREVLNRNRSTTSSNELPIQETNDTTSQASSVGISDLRLLLNSDSRQSLKRLNSSQTQPSKRFIKYIEFSSCERKMD